MHPLRLLPRFREAARSLEALQSRSAWPRDQIEALQLQRLNTVWAHASQYVDYYRTLKTTLRLPSRFDSLEHYRAVVPVLSKDSVRDQPLRFLSDQHEPGSWRWTSGSTGKPMRFYLARRDHQEMLRCRYSFYAHWGIDPFDRTAFLWGVAKGRGLSGAMARWQERSVDRLRNRIRLPAYRLERAELQRMLAEIQSFRPAMLYGLGNAVYHLALECRDTCTILDHLRVAIMTGEVTTAAMRRMVSECLSVPAIIEYGATECHLIAGQMSDGTLRVRDDVVLLETQPREDGGFDVVLTLLLNASFPLLRYSIEDVCNRPLERPPKGFAILGEIGGRSSDVLISQHDRVIHPARIDAIFESGSWGNRIRRYRVHQAMDGRVDVWLEPDGALDRSE